MSEPDREKQCKLPSRGEDMTQYLANRKRRKVIAKAQFKAQQMANNRWGDVRAYVPDYNRTREMARRVRQMEAAS